MAKTRMLKHDLRTSEKVASWPIPIRYFWVLLWGYVDDHGKGRDNPLLIKADCFPLDTDITGDTIDGWLWHLSGDGVIVRYTVEGIDYLAVKNWGEHQKPPHPTADVSPGWEDNRAVVREIHASRMKDAGKSPAPLPPVLGWVESGFGKGAHLTASVPFSDFWDQWPRKIARADAEKAWTKATRKVDPQIIVAAARALTESPYRPAKQFIPYPATWLNKEQWTDPPPEAPEDERKGTQKPTVLPPRSGDAPKPHTHRWMPDGTCLHCEERKDR